MYTNFIEITFYCFSLIRFWRMSCFISRTRVHFRVQRLYRFTYFYSLIHESRIYPLPLTFSLFTRVYWIKWSFSLYLSPFSFHFHFLIFFFFFFVSFSTSFCRFLVRSQPTKESYRKEKKGREERKKRIYASSKDLSNEEYVTLGSLFPSHW